VDCLACPQNLEFVGFLGLPSYSAKSKKGLRGEEMVGEKQGLTVPMMLLLAEGIFQDALLEQSHGLC